MIFFAILVVTTAGAAIVLRTRGDRRDIARWGLGLALVVAGLSHFADPTPFEQHLPDWVPAPDLLVAASGAAEVLLGVALVGPWIEKRLIGRIVAWFLVAVFPANVYVAVAGVEVDGQPGGVYSWLRLPFQLLFIAWALWSTSQPRPAGRPPTRGLIPALPWTDGRAGSPPSGTETVVMASVLELRNHRHVPGFLLAALRLRSLFARTPGAIRLSLAAIPLHKTFWTLSQWESREHLDAYVRHPDHLDVMQTYGARLASSSFTTWTLTHPSTPSWDEARAEIVRTRLARPVGHP